jgi:hypothetical protein
MNDKETNDSQMPRISQPDPSKQNDDDIVPSPDILNTRSPYDARPLKNSPEIDADKDNQDVANHNKP